MSGDIAGASTEGSQRIDRWLWASRFFKTRALARAAVNAGRVEVNGARAKPAKNVRAGDRVIVRGQVITWEVIVRGINAQRRPAPEAAALYEETEAGAAARERARAEHRARRSAVVFDRQRPDRRERRAAIRFRRHQHSDED